MTTSWVPVDDLLGPSCEAGSPMAPLGHAVMAYAAWCRRPARHAPTRGRG